MAQNDLSRKWLQMQQFISLSKNWRSRNVKNSFKWYLAYRFYNPRFAKPKLVVLNGMNRYEKLIYRQKETKNILAAKTEKLLRQNFNSFSDLQPLVIKIKEQQKGSTFINALLSAYETIHVSSTTKRDLKTLVPSINNIIILLNLLEPSINIVNGKTIKILLFPPPIFQPI